MKNSDKQIKMVDLQFADFALMLGLVRKEKQFRLSDDFSRIEPSHIQFSCGVSNFHNKNG